jgi:hypothetical protein
MGDLALGASAIKIRAGAIPESESSLFNCLRRHFRPNILTPSNSPPRRAVPAARGLTEKGAIRATTDRFSRLAASRLVWLQLVGCK